MGSLKSRELARFEFVNKDAILPKDSIIHTGENGISVKIFRRMRVVPLEGMRQPLLNAAIMGLETVLELLVGGQPATGYRWRLYRTLPRQFIQTGNADALGQASINIGLDTHHYSLIILEPKKRT